MTHPSRPAPPDAPLIYGVIGALEVMAGAVGVNQALASPRLGRWGRAGATAFSLGAVALGTCLLRAPVTTAARIRARKELVSLGGLVVGSIGNAAFGAPQAAAFLPSVCLSAIGAGMGGRESWRAYGGLLGCGSLATMALATDVCEVHARRLAGWAYVGTPISYVNASFLGACFGDASMRIREATESVAREQERTRTLRALSAHLEALAVQGRQLADDVETWTRSRLEGTQRTAALADVGAGRRSLQAVLDTARAGVAAPGDLRADLSALAEGWRQRGLAERDVRIDVHVDPRAAAAIDPSVSSQVHLLFSRYLQNVMSKEWTTAVGIEVTTSADSSTIGVLVHDNGGGTLPQQLGDGLWASRLAFECSLGGTFEIRVHDRCFCVEATAPVYRHDASTQDELASRWASEECTELISSTIVSTALTAAIQDFAVAAVDRRDRKRWGALLAAAAIVATTAMRGSRRRAAWWEPTLLSLGSAASAQLMHETSWSVTGATLMTTADLAWHHGTRRAVPLIAGHVLLAMRRGRGRADERRLAFDAVVPSATVVGAALAGRALLARLRRDEHEIGRALDRADLHLQIHAVLMAHHDLVSPFDAVPLERDAEGRRLVQRRDAQQQAYARLKNEFRKLLIGPDDLAAALRHAAEARAGDVVVDVEVDTLPAPRENRIGHEAAAVAQRLSMVDLVALATRRIVESFPRDLLGRRSLRRIVVRLRHVQQELKLEIESVPIRRLGDRELAMMASTAARAGGALDRHACPETTVRFPVP